MRLLFSSNAQQHAESQNNVKVQQIIWQILQSKLEQRIWPWQSYSQVGFFLWPGEQLRSGNQPASQYVSQSVSNNGRHWPQESSV